MEEFIDQDKLDQMVSEVMGEVEDRATLTFLFTNHTDKSTVAETMSIEDMLTPSETKTVIVGREYGTNLLTKVTVEYPKEASHGNSEED